VHRLAVTLGFLFAVSGCLGEASDLPGELAVYDFAATVSEGPQASSSQFHVNIEVMSLSNTTVETDVVLVVRRLDGSLVTERRFVGVVFHPEELWVLAESFLPGTSDRGTLEFDVVVYRHGTDEVLWRSPKPSQLVVQ
jgi:hypothetical protein